METEKEIDETIRCLCCYIREMAVMDVRRENFEHRKDIEKTTTALATLISCRAEKNTVINNTVLTQTESPQKFDRKTSCKLTQAVLLATDDTHEATQEKTFD